MVEGSDEINVNGRNVFNTVGHGLLLNSRIVNRQEKVFLPIFSVYDYDNYVSLFIVKDILPYSFNNKSYILFSILVVQPEHIRTGS